MSHQSLKKFIDLITFDQHAIDLAKKLEQSSKTVQQLQENITKEEQKKLQIESKKHELTKMVHEQELLLKDIQEQEKTLLKKIESISGSREYDAGVKELDQIRKHQSQEEQKYMQLNNKLENIQKEMIVTLEQIEQQTKSYQELILQEQHDQEVIKQELITADQQRAEKIIGISPEWLDTYEMMKGRVSDPVVAMSQESCSACFYGLTPRDLQLLKNKGLLQCKECYRLLYEQSASL